MLLNWIVAPSYRSGCNMATRRSLFPLYVRHLNMPRRRQHFHEKKKKYHCRLNVTRTRPVCLPTAYFPIMSSAVRMPEHLLWIKHYRSAVDSLPFVCDFGTKGLRLCGGRKKRTSANLKLCWKLMTCCVFENNARLVCIFKGFRAGAGMVGARRPKIKPVLFGYTT